MIFGTFDGVHDGHRHLFQEAQCICDELIVVVARDEHVLELKGHVPDKLLKERLELLSYESEISKVIVGDEDLGTYNVITEHEPTMIMIGYDQDELRRSLETWMEENNVDIRFQTATAYSPEIFQSSILREQVVEEML
jgi:cytidyltransferase-like protein